MPSGHRAVHDLPVVVAATALVAVAPALLAAWILPARGAGAALASVVLAMAIAAAVTRLCAAAWSRKPGRRELLFADLMLWSWLRTRWTERRLAAVQQRLLAIDAASTGMPIGALTRMGRLLEARDPYTYGHSRRVARHAQTIARAMHLEPDAVEQVRRAALVHDIGKIYTPHDILDKPDRLSDAEFDVVKRHPGDGADLLSHLGEPEVVAIVRHHHERLDGGGYPDGLRGDEIPLGARIIAVADTFDALTSTRAYRRSTSHKAALAILAGEAGTQLDADAVAAFQRHYSASRPATLAAAASSGAERLLSWAGGATAGLGGSAIGAAATAAAALTLGPALAPVTSAAFTARGAESVAAKTTPAAAAGERAARPAAPGAQRPGQGPRTTAERPRAKRTPAASRPSDQRPAASTPATAPAAATPAATEAATPHAPATGATATPAPAATVPAVTVPATPSTPAVTTPAVTLPATTTPAVTVPAIPTPVATVPAVTIPAVTLPAVTVPAVRLKLPVDLG